MLYVPDAFAVVVRYTAESRDEFEQCEHFVQRESHTGRNIERAACHGARVRAGREQVCLNDIIDICEITALRAVAEDRRRATLQHARDEFREHARILAARVLTRTENVEVAKCRGFQSVDAMECGGIEFTAKLLHGIR